MKCDFCGADVAESALRCESCKAEIRWKCPSCGQLGPMIEPKCAYCGAIHEFKIVDAPEPSPTKVGPGGNLDSVILRFFGIVFLIALCIAFLTSGIAWILIIALVFTSVVCFALARILDLAAETVRRVERLENDAGKRRPGKGN